MWNVAFHFSLSAYRVLLCVTTILSPIKLLDVDVWSKYWSAVDCLYFIQNIHQRFIVGIPEGFPLEAAGPVFCAGIVIIVIIIIIISIIIISIVIISIIIISIIIIIISNFIIANEPIPPSLVTTLLLCSVSFAFWLAKSGSLTFKAYETSSSVLFLFVCQWRIKLFFGEKRNFDWLICQLLTLIDWYANC